MRSDLSVFPVAMIVAASFVPSAAIAGTTDTVNFSDASVKMTGGPVPTTRQHDLGTDATGKADSSILMTSEDV